VAQEIGQIERRVPVVSLRSTGLAPGPRIRQGPGLHSASGFPVRPLQAGRKHPRARGWSRRWLRRYPLRGTARPVADLDIVRSTVTTGTALDCSGICRRAGDDDPETSITTRHARVSEVLRAMMGNRRERMMWTRGPARRLLPAPGMRPKLQGSNGERVLKRGSQSR